MGKLIFWSGILGVLLFVASSISGGFLIEGYSHIKQFISESYTTGIPNGKYLRYGGFIPSGILLALFAFMVPTVLPKSKPTKIAFWGIGLFYGLGTMVTGIFPCDMGCNPEFINPSISQFIHTISGSLTYLTVPLCILVIGFKAKAWPEGKKVSLITLLCGLIAACFVLILFSDFISNLKGLYQRIVEGSILYWILYMVFYIKRMFPINS